MTAEAFHLNPSPATALKEAALAYHEFPIPGKLAITPTKPLTNQRDLALAYSPGVAAACEAIVADPSATGEIELTLPD